MNINKEDIDELNSVIRLTVEKSDYEEDLSKKLKEYQKAASMPGFRPGKVPFGIIQKRYKGGILAEALNKIITEGLNNYLITNKFDLLGEPLTSTTQTTLDLDNQEEFEFAFDIALAPKVEVKLSKNDRITYYRTIVTDEMIENELKDLRGRFGTSEKADIVSEKSKLNGLFEQMDNTDNIAENGIISDKAPFLVSMIRDAEIKNLLINKKAQESAIFNIRKAFPNDSELSNLLGISKEDAQIIDCNFKFTIETIEDFAEAELNQEFFDKVYGAGTVSSKEGMTAKIKETLEKLTLFQSEFRFPIEIKAKLIPELNIKLPEEFLSRWLKLSQKEGENKPDDEFEKDFPKILNAIRWNLIINTLIKTNEFTVSNDDVYNYAKKAARMQFLQYGIVHISEDYIEHFAMDLLKDKDAEKEKEKRSKYAEAAMYDKVVNFIKETVTLDIKEISKEEFKNLIDEI